MSGRELETVPIHTCGQFGQYLTALDISNNRIRYLQYLGSMPLLGELIADHNNLVSDQPTGQSSDCCTKLRTLWVNHNDIKNLKQWLAWLVSIAPNIRW